MNKIVIPVILTVTILIAGIFAFMPIDKASTVHSTLQSSSAATTQTTTLQGNIDKQDRLTSYHFMTGTTALADSDNANILPFKDNAWVGNATIIVTDGSGTCNVKQVIDATGSQDGTESTGATQTGVGSSGPVAFASSTDRVEAVVGANMDCTIIIFLDQTTE